MATANDLNISQAGYVVFDGTATFTGRTFQAGTGVTLTNASGVSGNTTISASASVPTTFTEDSGSATPALNNLNVLGQQAGTVPVMFTIGSGSTINIEDRTWTTQYVVDPSATVGLRGTYTTIQAAITAATGPADIFIRPGTYTENLTLKDGVNLIGYANSFGVTSPVIISGKATLTTGRVKFDNVSLRTNGDFLLDISGVSTVDLFRCFILGSSSAFNGLNSNLNFFECNATDAGGATLFFTMTSCNILMQSCYFLLSSSAASTIANGSITIRNSTYSGDITTSGTADFAAYNSNFPTSNGTITVNGTSTSSNECYNCSFNSGAAVALSIGSGVSFKLSSCTILSTNTSPVAGAGTVLYSNVSFISTGSGISTTTQTPGVSSNDCVKVVTPGAYPYTTIPQDAVILVDSSSARTIVPLASPTTGQMHRIKDNVGSAAANNITITPSGKNIDGAASYVINSNYGSVDIVYNGTQWNVL